MPIYNGSQKVSFPGIEKIYVGNDLVYQRSPYIYLEYIRNLIPSSSPYKYSSILTDFSFNNSSTEELTIEFEFVQNDWHRYDQLIKGENDNNHYILYGETNNAGMYQGYYLQSRWGTASWTRNGTLPTNPFLFNTKLTCVFYKGNLKVNGTNTGTTSTSTSTSGNLKLFSMSGKFYGLSIRNPSTNVVTHNLVPVQRKADNMIGMYDTITDRFYYDSTYQNQWSAGPSKGSNYRQLEYIHFNGAEYLPIANGTYTSGDEFTLKFSIDDNSITRQELGDIYAPSATGDKEWSIGGLFADNGIRVCCGNWSNVGQFPLTTYLPDNTIRIIKTRAGINGTKPYMSWRLLDNNNTQLATTTVTGSYNYGLTGAPLWLMCLKTYTTSSSSPSFFTKGRIYEAYFDDGDSDYDADNYYKPCQRKSDKVCGLYDTVHQVFYPMVGTTITDGAAGPTVNENPDWN